MKKRILILMKVGILNQRMNKILMNIQIISRSRDRTTRGNRRECIPRRNGLERTRSLITLEFIDE